MFEVREHVAFWESLAVLDQTDETAVVVNALVSRVLDEPRGSGASEDGLRVVKSPTIVRDGRTYPALRLAYRLVTNEELPPDHPAREYVELLGIQAFQEDEEAIVSSKALRAV